MLVFHYHNKYYNVYMLMEIDSLAFVLNVCILNEMRCLLAPSINCILFPYFS